jgi:hypothetical protein
MDTNRSIYVRVANGGEHSRSTACHTTKPMHRNQMWMYRVYSRTTTMHY